jgi:hypothetical protein
MRESCGGTEGDRSDGAMLNSTGLASKPKGEGRKPSWGKMPPPPTRVFLAKSAESHEKKRVEFCVTAKEFVRV